MTDFYARLDYQEYKEFEAQLANFKALESSHTSTEGFYHNSFRMQIGNMSLEVHGPLVMAGEPETYKGGHSPPPDLKFPNTPPSGEHVHTHNGMGECEDYANCAGCHCHLQDERHTACCKGSAAREMYARHRDLLSSQQPHGEDSARPLTAFEEKMLEVLERVLNVAKNA